MRPLRWPVILTRLAILTALLYLGWMFFGPSSKAPTVKDISIDELYSGINGGQVQSLNIDGSTGEVTGEFTDHSKFKTQVADKDRLEAVALAKNVKVTAKPEKESLGSSIVNIIIWWLIISAIIVFTLWILGKMFKGKGVHDEMKNFGSMQLTPTKRKERFSDIAGHEETIEVVKEMSDGLKNPEMYKKLGLRIRHGILLVGPPGTGKTLMAKATAGEIDVPFFAVNGTEFEEMLVGAGASRVRDLFKKARAVAPCIIFIDEFDTIGRRRGMGGIATPTWADQTGSQLLAEMDGFGDNDLVQVYAATNQPELLDPAVLRRFDQKAILDLPGLDDREKICVIHSKGKVLGPDVNLRKIAKGTQHYSGSDLEAVMNEAGWFALRRIRASQKDRAAEDLKDFCIIQSDLEEAIKKVLMGERKKKSALGPEDLRIIAYHESGHALVTLLTKADPLREVTILARGMSGGSTWHEVDEKKLGWSREYFREKLKVIMAGRAAEEVAIESISTGAENDIVQATDITTAMICKWGFSDKVGQIAISGRSTFLSGGQQSMNCSEETRRIIDGEIKEWIDSAYSAAKEILKENIEKLHELAAALTERETLNADQVRELLNMPNPA
ncbi:MAG: ATP-dependent metallopeptidase FtsH/Yme1/Tma family protein [bacterium]|nr:ATP-dependent metallopeptidase FtsH/Yme1/Tma family protein [bacterium]